MFSRLANCVPAVGLPVHVPAFLSSSRVVSEVGEVGNYIIVFNGTGPRPFALRRSWLKGSWRDTNYTDHFNVNEAVIAARRLGGN